MSTAAVTTDTLPTNVPILDRMGTNWVIFQHRFQQAVIAKKKWGHFDSSKPRPTLAVPPAPDNSDVIQQWDEDEGMAQYLLGQ
jgi:hypothetical protein